jgi:hypothetical protein
MTTAVLPEIESELSKTLVSCAGRGRPPGLSARLP